MAYITYIIYTVYIYIVKASLVQSPVQVNPLLFHHTFHQSTPSRHTKFSVRHSRTKKRKPKSEQTPIQI